MGRQSQTLLEIVEAPVDGVKAAIDFVKATIDSIDVGIDLQKLLAKFGDDRFDLRHPFLHFSRSGRRHRRIVLRMDEGPRGENSGPVLGAELCLARPAVAYYWRGGLAAACHACWFEP